SSGVDRAATAAFVPAGSRRSGPAGDRARQGPGRALAHRGGVPPRRGGAVLRPLQRAHRRPALPRGRGQARLRPLPGHGRVSRTRPAPARALRRLGRPHRRRTPRRPGPPPTPRHGTPGHPPARPHSRLTPAHKGRGEPRTARQRTRTLARPAVEADLLGARGTAHGTATSPHPCTPGCRGRPQRGRGELRTPTTTPPHPPPTNRPTDQPTDRRSQPLTSPGRNPPHCRPAACSTDAR